MRITIGRKLTLGVVVLLLPLLLLGLVANVQFIRIGTAFLYVTEVDEPISRAASRLQINLAETALAATMYVGSHDRTHLERIADYEADYENQIDLLRRLSRSQILDDLIARADQKYFGITWTVYSLTTEKDQQVQRWTLFDAQVSELRPVLSELQATAAGGDDSNTESRRVALLEMETVIRRMTSEVAKDSRNLSETEYAEWLDKTNDEFLQACARYESVWPTVEAGERTADLRTRFRLLLDTAQMVARSGYEVRRSVSRLNELRNELSSLFGSEVQVFVDRELDEASRDSAATVVSVRKMNLLFGLACALFASALAFLFARNFTRRLGGLMRTVHAIAQGNGDARARSQGSDELAELATSLNYMADTCQDIDAELRNARDELEVRVLERTAELETSTAHLEEEVEERRRAEEELAKTALHDGLTGLPNRNLLLDRLEQCIKRTHRQPDYQFALLFIDLDNFKLVNDSLGHEAGDELLIEAARRINASLRDTDCLARPESELTARLGGDEFVVLLDGIRAAEDAVRVCDRIQGELCKCFTVRGHEVKVSGSIGIALNQPGQQAADLLRDADTAMYRAKEGGKARHAVFDATMHAQVKDRLQLENDLRRAIENKQLIVHYQPIVDLVTARAVALEALVRWPHPEKGMISPGNFIPMAEETGLIIPLGDWVLEESLRQLEVWNRTRTPDTLLAMNVNVSKRQLLDPGFVKRCERLFERVDVPRDRIHLEITESAIVTNPKKTHAVLKQLEKLGVEMHLDDFGTGLSSLSCLKDFPLVGLKIDRAFIGGTQLGRSYAVILHSIVNLAHNLGLRVVAEGVENKEQLAAVLALDCDFVQGFLFSEPVSAAQAETMLETDFSHCLEPVLAGGGC